MAPNRREMLALSNALVAGSLLAGCTGSSSAPGTRNATGTTDTATTTTDSPQSEDATTTGAETPVERVVAGNAEFAFDLLDRLAERSPEANLFCSPYSASVALAMTYAGARGETRRQMRETLHFPGERVHTGFRKLQDHFAQYEAPVTTSGTTTAETSSEESDEPVPFQLSGANGVWGQEGFPFLDAYLRTLERDYGAGLRQLDFRSNPASARRTINEWVADRTRGKIPDLLPASAVTELTRLVLTNATYFRANWASPFRPDATEDATFTALSGAERTVPLMTKSSTWRYAEVEGHQLVSLPYAGGHASMVVLLPEAGAFEAFQRSLSADRLADLLAAMESRHGTVRLPRFAYRSKFELSTVLSEMGMPSAFRGTANFTGMARGSAGESLAVDEVVHESYVSVDEEGTEAAAATGVSVGVTSAPETTFEMTVDRPFLFLIRDDETGTVLFLGRVVDAGAAQGDS